MTAGVQSNQQLYRSHGWSTLLNPTAILNIILACFGAGFLMYYIISVNAMAANEYSVSSIRAKIIKLTETQSSLSVQKSATENPAAAAAFAKDQHMVEAKDAVYVFENNNVALRK